ncbi:unknown [Bacteroides sp. CAG:661]|nr:unknown [Bacteroides sp. CAG:661]
MTNLNSENLRAYMNNGVVYQLMNCLIETDEKETTIVKDFILSQISKKNGRSLTNVRPVRRVLMN